MNRTHVAPEEETETTEIDDDIGILNMFVLFASKQNIWLRVVSKFDDQNESADAFKSSKWLNGIFEFQP